MRLRPIHVIASLGFAGLGWAMAWHGPWLADQSPQLRKLTARLHTQTLAIARSDTALRYFRMRDSTKTRAIEALERRESDARVSMGHYATWNRALLDSIAHLPPDSIYVLVQRLDSGMTLQENACTMALNSCDAAKDSLRTQIVSRDSIIGSRDTLLNASQALAVDAVRDDRRIRGQLLVTRVVALLSMLVAIIK